MKNHLLIQNNLKYLIIWVITFLTTNATSQVIFQKEYTAATASPIAMDTLSDGYLIAGTSNSSGAGGLDGMVMKTDYSGNLIWTKVYGGINNDRFFTMCRKSNNHFVLCGVTSSFVDSVSDPSNIYLVEIDNAGNLIRSASFGTYKKDVAYSIKETSDLGFIICGSTENNGIKKSYLIKTDSLLNLQWDQIYSNASNPQNRATAVVQTADGGYAITGNAEDTLTDIDSSLFILKTNNTGLVQSAFHFSFPDVNYIQRIAVSQDIILTNDGNLAIAGATGGTLPGPMVTIYTPLLLKISLAGSIIDSKNFYMNSGPSRWNYLQQTSDDGYLFSGTMGGLLLMLKADNALTKEWCYHYDQSFSPSVNGFSAKECRNNQFITCGSYTNGTKIRVAKVDSAGNSGCAQAIPIPSGGASSNVVLTQTTQSWMATTGSVSSLVNTQSGTNTMAANTICINTGINETENENQLNIYPNPCTNFITIESETEGRIILTDAGGRIILSDRIYGNTTKTIPMSDSPAGIYILNVNGISEKIIKE